jgi:hypothetical protein
VPVISLSSADAVWSGTEAGLSLPQWIARKAPRKTVEIKRAKYKYFFIKKDLLNLFKIPLLPYRGKQSDFKHL